jgi:hypothetical protein
MLMQVRRRLNWYAIFVEDQEGAESEKRGNKKTKQRYSFHGFHCFEENSIPISVSDELTEAS